MNIKQLLIRLNKVGIENREKALTLLVEGKEIDFTYSQMVIRQDDILLDTTNVTTTEVKKKVEKEVEKKEVKEEVPVIKATDLKDEAPATPAKKTRKKRTPKKEN
jgi:hypothetical protein